MLHEGLNLTIKRLVTESYLMKERMQKTSALANDCPQRDRTESERYGGVQTFMWMTEDNIVEVSFDKQGSVDFK